ncbi:F0F1 ATP synthase subunit A [Brachybacterium muris]|uniref:ATP synthase subunit a n=1 Tax=Brachybacterium muris UCD-AY4 TaxID=1249481 RepID=A0A022KRG6_9MICO|nr:F0F1 ATP synthase subunit A [Brachybacterium muris]PZP16568.1 MAG: ATP synthase F0 subunit A [Brachybacterium faecium]EYT48201.1 ATP synthase F0F1 subunit A [Brachybacterium muris UCD-AY4]MBM7501052.1 F-type H+-transporting ATPase subunit a [Brachybacterium muris]MCT1430191.1 F0F1 ATP synthase subunit A [Brachybacterium muris]MCT1653933.1 F0F1 ATP synthase subunit A [Brachybacterium muris]
MDEFFPDPILFAGTPFEFNRIQLVRLIILAAVLIFMCIVASRSKLVPGRVQSVVEMLVEFVHKNIVVNVLGEKDGRRFGPWLITVFVLILAMNLGFMVPGLNMSGTAVIGIPLLLALATFVIYVAAGIKEHGVGGYLKHATMPPGVPGVVYILLIPIELIQVFVVRWASLTIRLLANMVGGHMIIVVLIGLTHALVVSLSWLTVLSPLAGALSLGVFAFKIFVAALQAFIFTILSAVYIQMAVTDEH